MTAAPVGDHAHVPLNRRQSRVQATSFRVLSRAFPERERRLILAQSLACSRELVGELDGSLVVARPGSLELIERRREVVGRLTIGMFRHRLHTRRMKILNSLVGQAPRVGAHVVERQLVDMGVRVHPVIRLERLGNRRVEPARACEAKFRVQRLLEQRMSKVVHDLAAFGVLVDHARAPQVIQRAKQCVL